MKTLIVCERRQRIERYSKKVEPNCRLLAVFYTSLRNTNKARDSTRQYLRVRGVRIRVVGSTWLLQLTVKFMVQVDRANALSLLSVPERQNQVSQNMANRRS